jgi:hypothetical protein
MWEKKSNRVMEILIIVVFGAIVSVLNTLWLRDSLIKEVERIAKINERNIIKSKVTNISDKMMSS